MQRKHLQSYDGGGNAMPDAKPLTQEEIIDIRAHRFTYRHWDDDDRWLATLDQRDRELAAKTEECEQLQGLEDALAEEFGYSSANDIRADSPRLWALGQTDNTYEGDDGLYEVLSGRFARLTRDLAESETNLQAALEACARKEHQLSEAQDKALESGKSCLAALLALSEARAALPPSQKLRDLALWIDVKYPNDSDPEVQNDLRRWARLIDAALGQPEGGGE